MFSIKYCFENWIQSLPCTHIISSVHVHFAVAGKVILYLIFLGVSFVYLLIQWNFVQRGNVVPWNRNSSNLKNPRNHYSGFFSVTSSDIAKEKRRSQSMSSRSSSPSLLSINDVELSPSRDEDVLEGIKGEFILHHENLESLTTREDWLPFIRNEFANIEHFPWPVRFRCKSLFTLKRNSRIEISHRLLKNRVSLLRPPFYLIASTAFFPVKRLASLVKAFSTSSLWCHGFKLDT